MDIFQGVQYFYTSNGQQHGPVDGVELVDLAQQGQITAADSIWSEGFTEWLPAPSFSQLAPLYQTQDQAPSPPAGLRTSGGPAHGARVVKKHLHVRPAHRFREGARFDRMIILLVIGILFSAAAGYFVTTIPEEGPLGMPPQPAVPLWALFLLAAGGVFCLCAYGILSLVYLARAWAYIQELPVARTTPGKAVGFLFIPLFNLYWLFVAYPGWATDYNKYLDMAGAENAPRGKPGLAMAYCILSIVGFPFLHPFVMANLCQGINYLATAPKPEIAK